MVSNVGNEDDECKTAAKNEHLENISDGCGCAEIWEHLSEQRTMKTNTSYQFFSFRQKRDLLELVTTALVTLTTTRGIIWDEIAVLSS